MDLSVIRIVLVDPRIPENIGMAARAMKNCGLSRLVLVRGADPGQPAACRVAMDALSILEAAETFADLDAAVARSRMVVGTTRRAGQDRRPLLSPAEWIRDVLPRAAGGEISILFGTEKDGLTRDAVDRCDVLLTLGGHPEFPSFNVAQAVLLVAYELFRTAPEPAEERRLDLASAADREALFRHLETVMLRVGFLRANHGRILSTFRRLLGRTGLEEREIRILRGFLSQIEWALGAGNRAGSEGAGAGSPGGRPDEP
ncbi:MAG TPA: RNA methyltransferase [Candidatus Polarisedimenticolia bacterium]|jgi:tRNA/rRNA methyltransferase|nr:RNA methyltransferase [Candidatus Polarisedimenticolia bacterium]